MAGLGIAQGVGNIVGSFINAKSAQAAQESENRANMDLSKYAYSKDLEMWNRQNEYNSPSAQMARFNEAGLNPNLIYGQGNAGNSATLPKYNAPTIKKRSGAPNLQGVLPAYQDMELKQAQTDQTTAQTRLIDEKATTEAVNRAWLGIKSDQAGFNLGLDRTYRGDERFQGLQTEKNRGANLWWNKKLQMQQYDRYRLFDSKLAQYNWQLAEQKLIGQKLDNQHYLARNLGAGAVRGATNIGRGVARIFTKGKAPKLKTPKMNFKSNDDLWPNYQFR